MQTQRNEAQRIAVIAIASFFFLAAAVVIIWKPRPGTPQPVPVPTSTNELKVGAKLFNPAFSNRFQWTVIEIDGAYEFPDGEIRPGVRIRSAAIGGSTWVPRENLDKFYVVQ